MTEYEESMEPAGEEYFLLISFVHTAVQQAARIMSGNGSATGAKRG